MFAIGMASEDWVRLLTVLAVGGGIYAGPLAYRIIRGEKFTWFGNPSGRPNRRQWQALRERANRVISGEMELESAEFQDLIESMTAGMTIRRCRDNPSDQSEDARRVRRLTELFQAKGYTFRLEPFDSLADGLQGDGLSGAAQQWRSLVHGKSRMDTKEFRKASGEVLRAIKAEHWAQMSSETRKRWRECRVLVTRTALLRAVTLVTIFLVLAGLIIYDGWVRQGQYKYFQDNPRWLWGFAAFGLLVLTLSVAIIVSYIVQRRRRGESSRQRPAL